MVREISDVENNEDARAVGQLCSCSQVVIFAAAQTSSLSKTNVQLPVPASQPARKKSHAMNRSHDLGQLPK